MTMFEKAYQKFLAKGHYEKALNWIVDPTALQQFIDESRNEEWTPVKEPHTPGELKLYGVPVKVQEGLPPGTLILVTARLTHQELEQRFKIIHDVGELPDAP